MRSRVVHIVAGVLAMTLLAGAVYFGVRAAYGAFGDYYYLTVDLPRAGQQMLVGADVKTKGVNIGKVVAINLVDRHARLRLQILKEYRLPEDTQAVIALKTPLGAKYVDLRYETSDHGPYLADGDEVEDAHVGEELEDVLDDGVRVFEAIKPDDAGTIVSELAQGARGHGEIIARGLKANAKLSTLFANTLDPQLAALHDFAVIFDALEEKGVDLNLLAKAVNEGVPVYASERAQAELRKALEALVPFSDNLADLVILNRKDWDRMMNNGDRVLGTLAAHPQGLRDLVHGLYRYVYKLGRPIPDPMRLSDGSASAGFTNFIGGNSEAEQNRQLCDAFSPEEQQLIPMCNGGQP